MTGPVQITLLTQPACRYCDIAKEILTRLREEYDVAVTEIDLGTETGRGLAVEAGVMFAPGVLIDGQPFSFGRLSERKLRRALNTRTLTDRT